MECKEIYKELYHNDDETTKDLFYLKAILSGSLIKYEAVNPKLICYFDKYLYKVMECFDEHEVKIKDLLCYLYWLCDDKIANTNTKDSISGFKIYNSDKIIIFNGHHRIAKLILDNALSVKMKLFNAPEFLFKKWQNK